MKKSMKGKSARFLAAVLAAVLTLSLLGVAVAETYAVVYGTKSLNLRADASTSSTRLGGYPTGTWVIVNGSKNNFYAVKTYDGKSGYMSKNFLNTTDNLTYGNVAIVSNSKSTAFLNLRSYPSYSASVITILYNGVPLNVLSEENGWYRVQLGETLGYVRKEFTSVSYQPLGATVATIKTPNNTSVNMRVAPSAGASVRRRFAGDRYVSVIYQGTHWWYVCIDGYTGFISSDFLMEGLNAERDISAREEEDNTPADPDTGSYALVNNPVSSQRLNLRELPSAAANIVARLGNGTKLTMLVQGITWSKVYVPSLSATGYVMTRYLMFYNLPGVPMLTISHPQGTYVNLRSEASMTSAVVARMPNGSEAIVVTPGTDWVKIDYQGQIGYVINYFTSIAQDN
ncbi:MAG: SH3 domain-containing protein [Eubacteriales bacterium]|nr:SH3 domain-containing protein [Eubacteriales bacterium]